MRYTYCPDCGKKLTELLCGDDGMVPYCKDCDKVWFDTFPSCVIVLTYNEFNEVALSYQDYASKKYAGLTAGYMTPGENAEEAALRETKEELGLDIKNLEYAGTYWFKEKGILMHGFIAFSEKKDFVLSSEIDAAEWVYYKDAEAKMIPKEHAVAGHAILEKFINRLEKSSDAK